MRLLAATGNRHKLEEFRRILGPLGIEVVAPADVGAGLEVEETGATFAENARLKALALYRRTRIPAVADDSGLCVDALGGRPGVHSARYMGEDTPYAEKMGGLLREMLGVPERERTARFVAAICCALDGGALIECEGVCEGVIGHRPGGDGGFGFDPIFYVGGRSFAELPPGEKDALSHRGKALRRFAAQLKNAL